MGSFAEKLALPPLCGRDSRRRVKRSSQRHAIAAMN
jgi:hypothetical protein